MARLVGYVLLGWGLGLVGCRDAAAPPSSAPAAASGRDLATVVYVTRHAEKAGHDDDPPLSGKGQTRARALAARLTGVRLSAVYVTQFRRTQETAAPAAAAHRLTPNERPAAQPRKLVAEVLREHRGGAVLIVGHSDSVPEILAALGVREPVTLDLRDYGDLFVVTRRAGQPTRLTRERVGD